MHEIIWSSRIYHPANASETEFEKSGRDFSWYNYCTDSTIRRNQFISDFNHCSAIQDVTLWNSKTDDVHTLTKARYQAKCTFMIQMKGWNSYLMQLYHLRKEGTTLINDNSVDDFGHIWSGFSLSIQEIIDDKICKWKKTTRISIMLKGYFKPCTELVEPLKRLWNARLRIFL